MSEPLVVIGNGMAAARLVEELARRALGRYAVAVVGEEPRLAYNRVLLSALLAREVGASEIELKPARWWRDRGVTLRYGCAATRINAQASTIELADGHDLGFEKLVLATGSRPIRLAVPGIDLPGVTTFRTVDDVGAIERLARSGAPVVVIGGGLLGLEAAYGLAKAGAQVTVVHLMERLMERQLNSCAAAMLARAIEGLGVTIHCRAQTARIAGSDRVTAVELADGRSIEAGAVVVAAGITPNVDLAREAGLTINRGIVVDDHLATSGPRIHAIGECAEHRGQCYGIVEPAHDQARILAQRLAGEDAAYAGNVVATNLKVSGVNVFSAGDFIGAPGSEAIVLHDPSVGLYKKLVITGHRLTGAVLVGDMADGLWYLDLIRSGTPIGAMRDDLVFGRALITRKAA